MWLGQLDRFGYTLTVLESTKQKAIDAIMASYEKAFIDINGFDPREEENDRGWTNNSFYDEAKECIELRELKRGSVEWW